MNSINLNSRSYFQILFTLIFLISGFMLNGQSIRYDYYYRIYFRDKGQYNTSQFLPTGLLSEKAILRREKSGIPVPDFTDLPVYHGYIDQMKGLGLTFHCASKWMNTALFKSPVQVNCEPILDLPFVAEIKPVKMPYPKSMLSDKSEVIMEAENSDPPLYDLQLTMVNGNLLHASGFTGKGILIAVLDGGFMNSDKASSLIPLNDRKGIKAVADFVDNREIVYGFSTHGTAVLSILAGHIDGMIEGSAPGADFLLLRTEDTESEFPVEEDYWAAAAEYADSSGADIISSSLGYNYFDDPALNYKFTDFDGNTAFITRVADIAASKGIMIVNSAGNERNKEWIRIIAPADGDSVLTVGSVDMNGIISPFSSAGPSSDHRIKPDIMAMGSGVTLQTSETETGKANGTSFSCPVISGLAACLMQAVPAAINYDIIEALRLASDRAQSPDSLYGYGIPDMAEALNILQNSHFIVPDNISTASPNPTSGNIEIIFREPPDKIYVEIFTQSGKKLFIKKIDHFAGRSLLISELKGAPQGLYLIRLITESAAITHKIIKINP